MVPINTLCQAKLSWVEPDLPKMARQIAQNPRSRGERDSVCEWFVAPA
jgi:hypothetical protein